MIRVVRVMFGDTLLQELHCGVVEALVPHNSTGKRHFLLQIISRSLSAVFTVLHNKFVVFLPSLRL